MTTTKSETAVRTILALDPGKYKSVACLYDPATAQARLDQLAKGSAAVQFLETVPGVGRARAGR
jgi:hypothetical protein